MAASWSDLLQDVEEIVERKMRESIGAILEASTEQVLQRIRTEMDFPESTRRNGDDTFLVDWSGERRERRSQQNSFQEAVDRLFLEDTPLIDFTEAANSTGRRGGRHEGNSRSQPPSRTLPKTHNSEGEPKLRLGQFDGTSPIEEYLIQFHLVADRYNWNCKQRAIALVSELRGPALSVLSGMEESQRQDCFLVEEALKRRFGRSQHRELCLAQFRGRSQKSGEHIAEFAADLRRLAMFAFSDCPPAARERLLLQQFQWGIDNPELRRELRLRAPIDLDEAVRISLEFQATVAAENCVKKPVREIHLQVNRSDSGTQTEKPQWFPRRPFNRGNKPHQSPAATVASSAASGVNHQPQLSSTASGNDSPVAGNATGPAQRS